MEVDGDGGAAVAAGSTEQFGGNGDGAGVKRRVSARVCEVEVKMMASSRNRTRWRCRAPITGAYIYPLDGLGIASVAAYSTRLLSALYVGQCLRLRRSTDDAESNFGFSQGLLDTSAIVSWLGGAAGYVTKWFDQSGNAFDCVNATAANQPALIVSSSVFNNRPVLDFDGANDALQYYTGSSSAWMTPAQANNALVLAVASRDVNNAGGRIVSGGTNFAFDTQGGTTGFALDPGNSGGSTVFARNDGLGSASNGANGTAYIATGRITGTDIVAGVNGVEGAAGTIANGVRLHYLALGARALALDSRLNGQIGEALYFDPAPGPEVRTLLIDEAKRFWGVP